MCARNAHANVVYCVMESPKQSFDLPSNDGLDGIIFSGRGDDEPEEHVGHVDDPDGLGNGQIGERKNGRDGEIRTP